MATKKKASSKYNHEVILRLGFVVFLLIWGFDLIMRAEMWASPSLMGQFYGKMGTHVGAVTGLGVIQVLIAISFLLNRVVRFSSLVLFILLLISTLVLAIPLLNYLGGGGAPMPAILFADHFPLLAASWAIYAHNK